MKKCGELYEEKNLFEIDRVQRVMTAKETMHVSYCPFCCLSYSTKLLQSMVFSYTSKLDNTVFYILAHLIGTSEILPWDRKFYLTHAIFPRTSSREITS